MPSSQEFQTKLLYETMDSPLVEKTLGVTGQSIGEWVAKGRPHKDNDGWLHIFHNDGIPVTFEFHEDAEGALVKTRERPTFIWESTFKNALWFTDDPVKSANWLDGIMFPAVLPKDFVFGIVSEWVVPQLINGGRPARFVRDTVFTMVHFQPAGRFVAEPYNKPLEIETAMANAGGFGLNITDVAGAAQNYHNVSAKRHETIRSLVEMGFIHNAMWEPPRGHQLLMPKVVER